MSAKPFLAALLAMSAPVSAQPDERFYVLPSDSTYAEAAEHLTNIVRGAVGQSSGAEYGEMLVCHWQPELMAGIIRVDPRNNRGGFAGWTTFVAFDNSNESWALFVRRNPVGRAQLDEQRLVLQIIEQCSPAIQAYEAARATAE